MSTEVSGNSPLVKTVENSNYKMIDLFAGIGGIRLGFEEGFDGEIKTVFVSEIDDFAKRTYKENFKDDFEIAGDIREVSSDEIPHFNIVAAGFPCLSENTLVLTFDGYKRIDKIKIGDLVLTGDGSYHTVSAVIRQGIKKTYKVKVKTKHGILEIRATDNHKFYAVDDDGLMGFVPLSKIMKDISEYRLLCFFSEESRVRNKGEEVLGEILDVSEFENELVYDIGINGVHSFYANHILTHNCQAFSIAGKRMGFNDEFRGNNRGNLFLEIARICEEHKPEVIFCENVKGLLSHDKGRTFNVMRKTFEEIGYDVFYEILNSKDFGLAQNRERIYIVCFRKDLDIKDFEFPEGTYDKKVIRDILDEAPVSSKYYLSDTYLEALRSHKKRHENKGNGFGYEIRDLDNISGTVSCGGMGRERNLIIDEREHSLVPVTNIKGKINRENIRKMTPREWARLQGFPDDFKTPCSDTQSYKQFGNSVSVPVIKEIAKKIKAALEKN